MKIYRNAYGKPIDSDENVRYNQNIPKFVEFLRVEDSKIQALRRFYNDGFCELFNSTMAEGLEVFEGYIPYLIDLVSSSDNVYVIGKMSEVFAENRQLLGRHLDKSSKHVRDTIKGDSCKCKKKREKDANANQQPGTV